MKRLFIALFAINCAGAFSQEGFARESFVMEASGRVEIKPPGGVWRAAAPGTDLLPGTGIATGAFGRASLVIGGSEVVLAPFSFAVFDAYDSAMPEEGLPERVEVRLNSGRIAVRVLPPSGGEADWVIRSVSAACRAAGGAFVFDGREAFVSRGRIRLESGGRTKIIAAP